jgi:EAL domain-containing protein (putative c-di-GMP-specific phosphodiesterase class I)
MLIVYVLIAIILASFGFLYWMMIRLYQKNKEIDEKNVFLDELLKKSGISMYKAKRVDHQIFYYFKKEIQINKNRQKEIEMALWDAIRNNEFKLQYQPQLNLINNKIASLEALLRWNNPTLGEVDPAEFIPLVEKTGLISLIGEWTLYTACRTNKLWQTQGLSPVSVAVNISPAQFSYHNIAKLIASALDKTKLDPQFLEIEITENAIMEDIDVAIERLNEIKRMGVKISIDDFGTGYTSIKYIKHLPIDMIKIDQSFIKDVPYNKNDAAITNAIISLAHQLGLKVVVEGVETEEQAKFLVKHHCDIAQGYYFSKPLTETEIVEKLFSFS